MLTTILFLLASVASGGVACTSEAPCTVNGHEIFLGAEGDATSVIPLSLSASDGSRWPTDVKLIVSAGDRHWTVDLSRRELAKSGRFAIHAPAGEYNVVVEAPRHRRWQQRLRAQEAAKLVAARLEPLPSLGGRIVTREGAEPLAGAAIEIDEKVVAISDGLGLFTFDADPEKWPESVTVRAGGYGVAIVAIPRSRVSANLMDIELAKGGSVAVTIDRPETIRGIRLELFKRTLGRRNATPMQSKPLADDVNTARFDDVEAGAYVVTISGSSNEHFGRQITVKSGETIDVSASLRAMKLTLTAELAGAPLPGAHIRLYSEEGLWHESVVLNETARGELKAWQLGAMSALVSDERTLTSPWSEKNTLEPADEAEWHIHVSARELTGTIIDAASGKPIPNANVALRTPRVTVAGPADSSGKYRFTAITPGRHTLMAAAEGYSPAEVRFTYQETTERFEKNIELDPAGERSVTVRDAAGAPVAGAAVLNFAGLTLAGERFTDENGRVTIPIRPSEVQDVFAIPRDGSFGMATLRAGTGSVTIPEPRSTIVIRSETEAHEAIPDVWVVMRYNGMPIPFEVQQMLARMQGATPVSSADGRIVLRSMPSGFYEFWPVGSASEMRALMTGLGTDAPVKLTARPGPNTATLTFAKPRTPTP